MDHSTGYAMGGNVSCDQGGSLRNRVKQAEVNLMRRVGY